MNVTVELSLTELFSRVADALKYEDMEIAFRFPVNSPDMIVDMRSRRAGLSVQRSFPLCEMHKARCDLVGAELFRMSQEIRVRPEHAAIGEG